MATANWYFVSHVTGTVSTPNNALGAPNGVYTTDANTATNWTSRWRLDTAGPGFSATGTQSITLRMRKGSNSGNPTVSSVSLYQGGSLIGALTLFSGSTTISSTAGQDLVYQFDGSILAGIETVDIEIATTGAGGGPAVRNAASIDSGTWAANYSVLSKNQSVNFTLDDVVVFIGQTLQHSQVLSGALDSVTVSATQTLQHNQTLTISLDDVEVAVSQSVSAPVANDQTIAITLDSIAASVDQTAQHNAALAITLDDVTASVTQYKTQSQFGSDNAG
jgi:hypothetical protein